MSSYILICNCKAHSNLHFMVDKQARNVRMTCSVLFKNIKNNQASCYWYNFCYFVTVVRSVEIPIYLS